MDFSLSAGYTPLMANNLLESLEKLRNRLNNSGLQRTEGVRTAMDLGKDCYLYKKSLDIFLRDDFDPIKKLFLEVLEQYRIVDPVSFKGGT